jgi:hypothetical protein
MSGLTLSDLTGDSLGMKKTSRMVLRGNPDERRITGLTGRHDAGAPSSEPAAMAQSCVLTGLPWKLEQNSVVLFERSRCP